MKPSCIMQLRGVVGGQDVNVKDKGLMAGLIRRSSSGSETEHNLFNGPALDTRRSALSRQNDERVECNDHLHSCRRMSMMKEKRRQTF